MKYETIFATCTMAVICTAAYSGSIVVDGTLDTQYGSANALQNTQTGYGDSTLGLPDFANGSELDSGYIVIENDTLYIMMTGNLESTFNKIDIFIDARDGGQSTLRNDNPDVDFDGLNRMGDDGSGKNGLTFDEGFEADFWVSMTCGGEVFATFGNAAQLLTDGGGFGAYLGSGTSGAKGVITDIETGMQLALNNSNVGGVGYGEGLGCGEGVTTGIEISIPLILFNWDGDADNITSAKVCAFINNSEHSYVSNQVLGGLAGSPNLGDPRYVNFSKIAGSQYFMVDGIADACPDPTGACCVDDCNDLSSADCLDLGGEYHGDGTFCNGNPPPCAPEPCQGDVNGDGSVSVEDLLEVIANWGCTQ